MPYKKKAVTPIKISRKEPNDGSESITQEGTGQKADGKRNTQKTSNPHESGTQEADAQIGTEKTGLLTGADHPEIIADRTGKIVDPKSLKPAVDPTGKIVDPQPKKAKAVSGEVMTPLKDRFTVRLRYTGESPIKAVAGPFPSGAKYTIRNGVVIVYGADAEILLKNKDFEEV